MYRFATLLTAVGLVLLCGCSIFNKGRQIITITTDPPDTRLIVNGIEYPASSPQFVEVVPSREVLITAFKPYYRTRLYTVDYHLNDTGKIDAWSGMLLFPLIGLMTNGAWELEENNIYLKLEPMNQEEVDALNRTTKPKPAEQVGEKTEEAKTGDVKATEPKPDAAAAKAPVQKIEAPVQKIETPVETPSLPKPAEKVAEKLPIKQIEKAIEKLPAPKIEKPAETK